MQEQTIVIDGQYIPTGFFKAGYAYSKTFPGVGGTTAIIKEEQNNLIAVPSKIIPQNKIQDILGKFAGIKINKALYLYSVCREDGTMFQKYFIPSHDEDGNTVDSHLVRENIRLAIDQNIKFTALTVEDSGHKFFEHVAKAPNIVCCIDEVDSFIEDFRKDAWTMFIENLDKYRVPFFILSATLQFDFLPQKFRNMPIINLEFPNIEKWNLTVVEAENPLETFVKDASEWMQSVEAGIPTQFVGCADIRNLYTGIHAVDSHVVAVKASNGVFNNNNTYIIASKNTKKNEAKYSEVGFKITDGENPMDKRLVLSTTAGYQGIDCHGKGRTAHVTVSNGTADFGLFSPSQAIQLGGRDRDDEANHHVNYVPKFDATVKYHGKEVSKMQRYNINKMTLESNIEDTIKLVDGCNQQDFNSQLFVMNKAKFACWDRTGVRVIVDFYAIATAQRNLYNEYIYATKENYLEAFEAESVYGNITFVEAEFVEATEAKSEYENSSALKEYVKSEKGEECKESYVESAKQDTTLKFITRNLTVEQIETLKCDYSKCLTEAVLSSENFGNYLRAHLEGMGVERICGDTSKLLQQELAKKYFRDWSKEELSSVKFKRETILRFISGSNENKRLHDGEKRRFIEVYSYRKDAPESHVEAVKDSIKKAGRRAYRKTLVELNTWLPEPTNPNYVQQTIKFGVSDEEFDELV